MFSSSKFVLHLPKSCAHLNTRPSNTKVQSVPQRLQARGIHTKTSGQMPHWKTAGNLKGRLLITGGALTTAGTPRRTFRSKPALPLNFQSFRMAKDAEEGEMLWAARKTALWSALALKHNPDDDFLAADACVPVLRLGDIIERTHAMLEESGLVGCCMGHVGDGNFHTMTTFSAEEKTKARRILLEIQKQSVDLDGTVTGEHGIGLEYRDQVVYELGSSSVDAMRRVKYALGPLFLLNLRKMIKLSAEKSDG